MYEQLASFALGRMDSILPQHTFTYCWASTSTLIRTAGDIYDSRNFEQKQLKMAWSKTVFYPRFIPHKMCQNYILLKIFITKMLF